MRCTSSTSTSSAPRWVACVCERGGVAGAYSAFPAARTREQVGVGQQGWRHQLHPRGALAAPSLPAFPCSSCFLPCPSCHLCQVLSDMNKARTDDLADIQPSLTGLKPKLV